jgi:hypothetical protein
MMHRILKLSALALLFVAATCLTATAQQTLGGITGTVVDPSGSAVPGVQVTVVSDGTKLTRTTVSNGQGSYQILNLPIGTYTVTFGLAGFSAEKFPGIVVQADRTVTLPAQLKVGGASDSVTVEATPLLNAVDTTNGYVLDKAQIGAIPLPTGSFTGVAILSPGVNAELPGGTGANSGLGNAPIWANGQRDTSNSFLLNGVDASNLFNGKSTSQVASARVVNNTGGGDSGAGGVIQSNVSVYLAIGNAIPTPAPETLAEVKVNSSMYDTSQGGASGAHIDVSTSSGTNDIHGSAYFHRGTNWLNAAPFFFKQDGDIPENEKNPQLHRYTAGGSIGGPIIKDKLFFYGAYQHVHVSDQETGISRLTVPVGLTNDRSAATLANLANNNFGTTLTGGAVSPVALFLLNYPALPGEPGKYLIPNAGPNTPSAAVPDNATIPGTSRFTADQGVADLDWNATTKDTLSAKYYYQHDPTVAPYGYSSVPGFAVHVDTGSQVFSLTNTLTLRSNLSTVQSLGFIREKVNVTNEQPFTSQQAGINSFGFSYFPGITILDALGNNNDGGQNPDFLYNQGFAIGAGPGAQGTNTGVFQNRIMPTAAAFLSLGKHTISFGGSYAYTQLETRDNRTNKGMISTQDFGGFLSGQIAPQNVAFTTTTFLLGNANRYYRAGQSGAFVQDKFQLLPNLSITAGLRYDWNGGLSEKYGRIFNFDPSQYAYNATSGQVTSNGFIIAGNSTTGATPGVSNTTLTGRQWGIAPRLGVAWQPDVFHSKVVVRAGTGFYYDRGELFSYLSPGYAAGEVTGGPYGANQTPPFVNAIQCDVYNPGPQISSPCTPDSSGTYTLSNPWGITPGYQPSGKASDISKYLPSAASIINGAPLFSFANYDRANKLPYTINYTLDIQWQPRNDLSVTLGYVGNLGRHQVIPIPFNQANVASPTNILHPGTYQQKYTYGYAVQAANSNCGGYSSCAPATLPDGTQYLANYEGGNIDLRVPYIGYSAESETYRAGGISSYNAFTAHVEKRMSHGLQMGVSYTYSHALDEQSGIGLFYNGNNPLNLRDGYASSDFDRTHVINGSLVYQFPKVFESHALVSKVVNGWAIQGLGIIQSGQPYSIIDYSGAVGSIFYGVADGITNPIVPLNYSMCSPKTAKTGFSGAFVAGGGAPALNANCFYVPLIAPGGLNGAIPGPSPDATAPQGDTFETNFTHGQRNIFRQSYQKRADASLVKAFTITERYKFQYTFDVFNLTNTASFDIPGDNVTQNGGFIPDPTAAAPLYNAPTGLGVTTHTIGSARQIQMSLRMLF